jgi:tRNA (guanine37-N1)-methyltransferase
MKFDILTLFPGMFEGPLTESILRRALERGLIHVALHNIRDYATDRHRITDDAPYGGGAGMVMKPEPLAASIEAAKLSNPDAPVLLMSPCGKLFTNDMAAELAGRSGIILVCGRYEGVDERISRLYVDREVSVGDFVMTGGELAAMMIVDAVSRFIPGVLGTASSAYTDSFSGGLLEYPQYTRPPEFGGLRVPEVLLSGNHADIERWRRREALRRTLERRPDLMAHLALEDTDRMLLQELEEE